RELLSKIDDLPTHQAVIAERMLLATLRGGCLAPVCAWARESDDGRLQLSAALLSVDGSRRLSCSVFGNGPDARVLGRQAAEKLLGEGAEKLIAEARVPQ